MPVEPDHLLLVARIIARVIFTPLLFFLLLFAFGSCIAVETVDNHLLNASFYLDALDNADAYHRAQTDFLLDIEQADTTNDLIANTDITPEEIAELVSEVVPVDYVRAQFEFNVRNLVSYLRGDRDDLLLMLELGPVFERLGPAVSAFVVTQIGEIELREVDTYSEYKSGLASSVLTLTDGAQPTVLPTFDLSDDLREEIIDEVFANEGLLQDDEAREAVDASLRVGRTDQALIAVVDAIIDKRVAESIADLQTELDNDQLDLVAHFAEDEDKTREEVLEEFRDVRDAAEFILGWGAKGPLLLFLLAALLLGVLYLPGRAALLVPGIILTSLGALGLLGWALFQLFAPGAAADSVRNNESDLSPAAVEIVADVVGRLVRGSVNAALQPSFLTLILGTAGIAAAIVLTVRAGREPGIAERVREASAEAAQD